MGRLYPKLTVRISERTEQEIRIAAESLGMTDDELVRTAIYAFIALPSKRKARVEAVVSETRTDLAVAIRAGDTEAEDRAARRMERLLRAAIA